MNFFYAINVNDRYRFPIVKKEKGANLSLEKRIDVEVVEDKNRFVDIDQQKVLDDQRDNPSNYSKLFSEDKEGYFEAFKRENLIPNCEKGLFCDDILKFLDAFFKKMKMKAAWLCLQDLLDDFNQYVLDHRPALVELMKTMNVKQLITPYIELELPVKIIDEYNRLEQGDPRVHFYQLNPVWGSAIREFGYFLDRYESTKEVLCMFIWSTVDRGVVTMPAVGLNPYPLCWVCDKGFGTISCSECHVAKYCSKECQMADWIKHGGPACDLMASVLKRVKHLCFQ